MCPFPYPPAASVLTRTGPGQDPAVLDAELVRILAAGGQQVVCIRLVDGRGGGPPVGFHGNQRRSQALSATSSAGCWPAASGPWPTAARSRRRVERGTPVAVAACR